MIILIVYDIQLFNEKWDFFIFKKKEEEINCN